MNTQFKAGELIKLVLDRTLSSSANSTSCSFVYQPKAPKKLEMYNIRSQSNVRVK
jgi:cyclic lactone autoinducer peptide